MPANVRRHSVLLSDREQAVLERAVRLYALVIAMQLPIHQREINDARRIETVVGHHRHCACPVPPEPTIEGAH